MDKDDVLSGLKGGFGLAGKLVSKSVDEVSKAIRKGDDSPEATSSGLFYVRLDTAPEFGLKPRVRFHEPQTKSRRDLNLLQNLTMSAGEKAFIQAVQALLGGSDDEALSKLRLATGKSKDSKVQLTDAYFLLGTLVLSRGDTDESIRNLKTALLCQQSLGRSLRKYLPSLHATIPLTGHSSFCLHADLLGLNSLMAVALKLSGKTDEAVHTLEQLLEIMPGEPLALFFVNLFRLELGAHREIYESLQKVLPDSNLQVACMVLLGKACSALGDPITGREIFRKALQRADLDPALRRDLRYGLGEALAAEGWANDAVHEFEAVKSEDPGFQPLYRRLSVAVAAPAARPAAAPAAPAAPAEAPPQPWAAEVPEAKPEPPAEAPRATPTRLVSEARGIDRELGSSPLVVGREDGDIVLQGDTAASRTHAQVTFSRDTYWIEDLGSTNGTWVNRHRISRPVELHPGDAVQIGETTFQVL